MTILTECPDSETKQVLPSQAARAWTLGALTILSPLFVEPVLQILEPSWGPSDGVLVPTLVILGFVLGVNFFFALGSLASRPELQSHATALKPQAF